ncbi:hypothetical protein NX943_004395 [Salmonella enterica]|nr:hypothetical protein [Salmonella enterica]
MGTGSRYSLIKRLEIKHLLAGGLGFLILAYLFYTLRLNTQTQDILQQLTHLLR